MTKINVQILPRLRMSWEDFINTTPRNSIALDGVVRGGPRFCPETKHVNFDHHEDVVREATMSTAKQVWMAIKNGLMGCFGSETREEISVYINDTDQDTSLAVWLLLHHKEFEGTKSIPHINRFLHLNDVWDITGGAFPMDLSEQLIRQHNWVFTPYTDIRKSGELATAGETTLRNNLEAVLYRLDKFMMGQSGEVDLDTRHIILFDHPKFKIVDEIGGNTARYYLFSKGMRAYISILAHLPNGNLVCTIGKSSQFVDFPIRRLYGIYNAAEGKTDKNGWNGSDIIGGIRHPGTNSSWEKLRDLTLKSLHK